MPRSTRRNKSIEVSGVFGKHKPSTIYNDQTWTYTCNGCITEIKFLASQCPNCGKVFDWSKPIMVDAKDYDPVREESLRRAIGKNRRRKRR